MGDSGAGDLPAQELSAELKVNLPVEQVEKLKRAVELAKELVKQQKEHNKAVQESNDLANKSQQAGGGSRGMIPHGGGPGGPGGGYGSGGGPGSSALTIYGGQGMRPGNDSSNWLYEQMKAEFVRWVQSRYGSAEWSARGGLGGRGAPKLLGSNEFTGRPQQDGWRDLGERTTYGTVEDRQIARDAISGAATSSKMAIAARIGGYVTYAAKIALEELDARNKADIALQQGGTGSDVARAGLNSNFFTRQALGAYDTITNREGKLYEVQLGAQRAELRRQAFQERRDLALSYIGQRRQVGAGIAAIDQLPNVVQSPFFDTMTLAGRTQSEEFQRRAPIFGQRFELERQIRATEIEMAGVQKQIQGFQREFAGPGGGLKNDQLQAEARQKKEEDAKAAAEKSRMPGWVRGLAALSVAPVSLGLSGAFLGGPGSSIANVNSPETDAKRLQATKELARIKEDIDKLNDREKKANEDLVELTKKRNQLQAELKRTKVEELRADAAMFNQRADEAEGQSRRIGRMSPLQRNLALNALKTFMNSANPDMLPNEIIDMASGIAPGTVEERLGQIGARAPQMLELQRIAGNEFKGDPNELRKKAVEAANEANKIDIKINQDKLIADLNLALSPKVEAAFDRILRALWDNANKQFEQKLNEKAMQIKNGQQ